MDPARLDLDLSKRCLFDPIHVAQRHRRAALL
jgi:hypothetical protein